MVSFSYDSVWKMEQRLFEAFPVAFNDLIFFKTAGLIWSKFFEMVPLTNIEKGCIKKISSKTAEPIDAKV